LPLNLLRLEIERSLLGLSSILLCLWVGGCEQGSTDHSRFSNEAALEWAAAPTPEAPVDHLAEARRWLHSGELDAAAQASYQALVQDPDSPDARLVAAEIEAARGNPEVAAELAGSIDLRSPLAGKAVQLHAQQLLKAGRASAAADVLLAAIEAEPKFLSLRHQAWELLNFSGRRNEASAQALELCRAGLATEHELLSLISRSLSFPTPEMLQGGRDGAELFAPGLGKARWYFSLGDHQRALEELAAEQRSGFPTPAAEALYGRLLAERQRWDEFPQWSFRTMPQTRQLGDYWAAIGNFFVSQRRYEAASRALLEAIYRDPTDRVSVQRLSLALFAINRTDDGEQFKFRGVEISNTEQQARTLYASGGNLETRKSLARAVLELGRPYETLAWTRLMLPASATQAVQAVDGQRIALLQDKSNLAMAAESSLMGLDRSAFDMQPAWQELLADATAAPTPRIVAGRDIAATPRLVDQAGHVGLDFQWYKDVNIDLASIPIHESLGGGIAVLDYDLDGWPDVYLAQGSGDPPTDQCTRSSQLLRNRDQAFTEVTSWAGAEDFHYSSGLAAGDVNQDGFPDMYLGSLGHNRLLVNNGDGTFRDASPQLGDYPDRFTTSLAIADINGDALPDLFEANYIEMEGGFALPRPGPDGRLLAPTPLRHFADSDRWFENLGDGRFRLHELGRDVAKPGTSLGVVVTDFDDDGRNEVFVGNDVRPNHYLVQTGDNRFVNLADSKGLANGFDGAANGCMGIATGDFNRDGRFDLQIANYSQEAANLYLQTAGGDFLDESVRYGLADPTRPMVGFGTKAVDIDRNGFLDFIVSNGHIFDQRHRGEPFQMPPQLLLSDGRRLQVVEVEDASGYWQGNYLGRSIAMLDYDRDGAMDFLVGHLDRPLALLHDQTQTSGGWLQVELVGTTSERDAIGAKVVFTVGGSPNVSWVTAGDGYLCSDEPFLAFAFAEPDPAGQLEVHWPSGNRQVFSGVGCGQRWLIIEGDSAVYPREPVSRATGGPAGSQR
jgi:tetratricopeptide (TPR) repeat protein